MARQPLYPSIKEKPKPDTLQTSGTLQKKRWLRALAIAKILFEDEGYHINYLREIEQFIIENK